MMVKAGLAKQSETYRESELLVSSCQTLSVKSNFAGLEAIERLVLLMMISFLQETWYRHESNLTIRDGLAVEG